MEKKLLFVGLDVDTKAFHACLICQETGEFFRFQCTPDSEVLLKKLHSFRGKGYELRVCYEASYIGNSLYHDLSKAGVHCDIIASSLIPKKPGDKVKNDRLDADKLAEFYMKGLLTPVYIPDPETESVRDLIRSRKFLQETQTQLKGHIMGMCRRLKLNYKETTGKQSYWLTKHVAWLEDQTRHMESPALRANFIFLLRQYQQNEKIIDDYNAEIEKFAQLKKYKKSVTALNCFRGISTLTAMQLITEIGDIHRFKHPRLLTSYAGMDIIESSSGGNTKQFHITKMGNRHIRTAVIEACQRATNLPRVSRAVLARQKIADEKSIETANKCMRRLYKKGTRLLYRGKPMNKIKVACAREMLGFIWESLKNAA